MMWERDTSGECPDEDQGSAIITDGSTSYTITGLEEDSSYTITVTATNAAGSAVSDPVTGMTGEAGEGLTDMVRVVLCSTTCLFHLIVVSCFFPSLQFHPPLPHHF